MRNFQEKPKWRKFMESRVMLFFLGFFVLFFGWNVIVFVGKMRETSKNRQLAEEKVAELRETKAKLSADISKLNTEGGVEESIRDKFGLVKEGEDLIVVVEEKEAAPVAPVEKKGFFASIAGWFK